MLKRWNRSIITKKLMSSLISNPRGGGSLTPVADKIQKIE